jgi:transcriptional regulator with AbiEi antitoxin domain of type IV toxin-antitoxin system
MREPFIGGEAIRVGRLTRGQLRWNHTAVHPGVYLPNDAERTLHQNTVAAWLWTGRRAVIGGRAAAALHGAKWVDPSTPIEVIAEHTRRREGIIVHEERIAADEITYVGKLPVTTIARTALDIARHLPRDVAVAHLDALANATGVGRNDVVALASRYPGARGIARARIALSLMDAGAQSPGETRLRLLLIDDGLPAPRSQIRVSDGHNEAFIDMGYDEPQVGLDYEGTHHSENRGQYVYDIGRTELIESQGWTDLRVVKEHSRRYTLHRVREAFAKRGWVPPRSA